MYYAVGNRCAIDFNELRLPISEHEAIEIIQTKGFKKIDVDIVSLAISFVGVSTYRRSARLSEAPGVFDCSSFVKWLYGQRGIWLPRRSIQQRECGMPITDASKLVGGDIVFVSGHVNYFLSDPLDGVGHVGIVSDAGTVVHAANSRLGIVESTMESFTQKGLRGIRRIIPSDRVVHTFITPDEREVEYSDDIRWIVLQTLTV